VSKRGKIKWVTDEYPENWCFFIYFVSCKFAMTDILTKKQRSYNMSMIKGKNTKPEITLRKILCANGLRGYRVHYTLPGRPDIAFSKRKIAIFIDGCFWHKCPQCFIRPSTNKAFWSKKIGSNVKRDRIVNAELKKCSARFETPQKSAV